MSDENQTNDTAQPSPENGEGAPKQVRINAQYVKDLSFENPKAPESIMGMKEKPKIDVNVDVKGAKLKDDVYEVLLNVSAKASTDNNDIFLVDLTYGGLFTLTNITDEEIEQVMLIYCPNLLFPYARRVISDATRDGGFPPLMLEPIDFSRLYAGMKQGNSEQAAAN